jgi:putative two-component system response regulator
MEQTAAAAQELLDCLTSDVAATAFVVGSHDPLEAVIRTAKVMIVDDESINIKVVRQFLRLAGYRNFISVTHSNEVQSLLAEQQPDVILLDVVMPNLDGLTVLQQIRTTQKTVYLPVIILSASDDTETKIRALELGATDFLAKPVNSVELVSRVRNSLLVKAHYDHLKNYARELEIQVRRRTVELAASRLELIHCLARAAEQRDHQTGRHVLRVGRYAGIIGRQLGLDATTVELLECAAPLHDMGKIGVPDAILRKPAALDAAEFEIMKQHPGFGKQTFKPLTPEEWRMFASHTFRGEELMEVGTSPLLTMAGTIALTHHEKWDGSGYPCGLRGEAIPLVGRITAVADVFDALGNARPYKPAFPLEQCFQILEDGRGTHFDPRVLDAFFAARAEIIQVSIDLADTE